MESEWVRIMPFIEKPVPLTFVNSDYPGVKESKEIYDYFYSINPRSPIDEFKRFYASLPSVPRLGQTRSEQIVEAIRIMKLADKVKSQMNDLGIKVYERKDAVIEAESRPDNPSAFIV